MVVYIVLSVKALKPASHNFTIEMRDMCERPGNKCASIPLSDSWGNDSVHTVFDGSLLPHAEKNRIV